MELQEKPQIMMNMASIDQRLEHATKNSLDHESDGTSRYLTFQGHQINTIKMSFGNEGDVSSKLVQQQSSRHYLMNKKKEGQLKSSVNKTNTNEMQTPKSTIMGDQTYLEN